MAGALAEIDGYPGARDMLQAFVAALDGDRERLNASLAAAIPALEKRGLRFAIAVDLWAIGQRIPLDRSWDAYRRVDEWLVHAGAEWLRRELGRLAAAP
jgi:hypothetical protein